MSGMLNQETAICVCIEKPEMPEERNTQISSDCLREFSPILPLGTASKAREPIF